MYMLSLISLSELKLEGKQLSLPVNIHYVHHGVLSAHTSSILSRYRITRDKMLEDLIISTCPLWREYSQVLSSADKMYCFSRTVYIFSKCVL